MSFREKSAWVSLVTTLGIWGYYFLLLTRGIASGDPSGGRFLGLFITCTMAVVTMQVILYIILAIHSPKDAESYPGPMDERERLVDYKATRNAFAVLNLLAMTVAIATPVVGMTGPAWLRDPGNDGLLLIGSGIFFAIVAAEVVRSGSQIFYFRRMG
jgi:ABC-type transport system involved in multi-copper enzyme maturation permease subunit